MFGLKLSGIPTKNKGPACLEIVELLNEHLSDDFVVCGLTKQLKKTAETLIDSMGHHDEIEMSNKIRNLNNKTDDAFRALVHGLRIHTHLPYEKHKDKAQTILDYILPDHVAFLSSTLLIEDTLLHEKIDFLELENNLAFLKSIHLKNIIDILKDANDAFNDLYNEGIISRNDRPAPMCEQVTLLDNYIRSTNYYLQGMKIDNELISIIFEPLVRAKTNK